MKSGKLSMANLSQSIESVFGKISDVLFPPSNVLGIDIGTTSIKVVELNQQNGVITLQNYGMLENFGHLERENAAIQTSSLKIMDEMTASLLKELLKAMGQSSRNVVFSLPAFSSFVTVMELPSVSEKEVVQAIPYEARQYVPFPLTEVVLDWEILSPLPGVAAGRTEVLLIAVLQEVVNKYYRIAELAGLKLKALELEPLSLARAMVGQDPTATIVIDMGARVTSISIVDEKNVRLTHDIDTAGNDLTMSVARGLNISPIKAEELKRARGLSVASDQQFLPALMTPILDSVINEVKKMMRRYMDHTRRDIKKAVLTGGAVLPPGIKEYFAKELGIDTLLGNPFAHVSYNHMLEPIIKESGNEYSVALGAALKGFKK